MHWLSVLVIVPFDFNILDSKQLKQVTQMDLKDSIISLTNYKNQEIMSVGCLILVRFMVRKDIPGIQFFENICQHDVGIQNIDARIKTIKIASKLLDIQDLQQLKHKIFGFLEDAKEIKQQDFNNYNQLDILKIQVNICVRLIRQ